jgi:hypothetical protein
LRGASPGVGAGQWGPAISDTGASYGCALLAQLADEPDHGLDPTVVVVDDETLVW